MRRCSVRRPWRVQPACLALLAGLAGSASASPSTVIPRAPINGPTVPTIAQALEQRAQTESWCVVWDAPFEPVGPAPKAWRYQGPGDTLERMVTRGVDDWDRATSATWQITASGDDQRQALHARIYLAQRTVVLTPVRDEDRSPPTLPPLRWGACPATSADW